MGNLMKMEDREMPKEKFRSDETDRIKELREKILNGEYIDHAINRIATDLSHYLTK